MKSAKKQAKPKVRRDRPVVALTLSPEARVLLDKMAERAGESRSGMVEWLIRWASTPATDRARLRDPWEVQ